MTVVACRMRGGTESLILATYPLPQVQEEEKADLTNNLSYPPVQPKAAKCVSLTEVTPWRTEKWRL